MGRGVLKFASCFLILSTLKELRNYNRKIFLCPAQELDGKKTNILNCYFSKKIYTLVHQAKYLHMEN